MLHHSGMQQAPWFRSMLRRASVNVQRRGAPCAKTKRSSAHDLCQTQHRLFLFFFLLSLLLFLYYSIICSLAVFLSVFFVPIKCHVAQNGLKLNMYQRMLLNSDPPTSTSRVWDYRCVPLQTVFEVLGIKSKSLCLSGEHCTHLMRYTTSLAPYMPGKIPTYSEIHHQSSSSF